MRKLGVLRRAFPHVKDARGTGYISSAHSLEGVGLEPRLSPSGFPYSGSTYCTLCDRHFALRAFSGLLWHEKKELSTHSILSHGTSFAHHQKIVAQTQKIVAQTPDIAQLECTESDGVFSRFWIEGRLNFKCFLLSERDDRPKQVDVGIFKKNTVQGVDNISRFLENGYREDMQRVKNGKEKFKSYKHKVVGGGRIVDGLNCQLWLYKTATSEDSTKWTKRNAFSGAGTTLSHSRSCSSDAAHGPSDEPADPEVQDQSQRAVVMALWCNFLVLSLKCGVWMMTASHVMLAEAVHSLADLANQALLAYGLVSSRRAPDALHPYGYSKERFVWSLISAVGIFCLGSGATIVHGVSNLWSAELPENIFIAALVLAGSMIMEGASLLVALSAVRKGASAEGMTLRDYVWRGHDPTAVAVMMEDGAAVTGLVIAGLSLVAVSMTGNPIYDPIGSIFVGNLLGMVAIFLIQRNRHALLGRAMDDQDMKRVLDFLSSDPVVDAVYDCKSEVIGPRSFRFKAEIDFNGDVIVQNYLERTGREVWTKEFKEAMQDHNGCSLDRVMKSYGEEVVLALGSEVDRLEKEIQRLVPGIRHVDIETHNPNGPSPL